MTMVIGATNPSVMTTTTRMDEDPPLPMAPIAMVAILMEAAVDMEVVPPTEVVVAMEAQDTTRMEVVAMAAQDMILMAGTVDMIMDQAPMAIVGDHAFKHPI